LGSVQFSELNTRHAGCLTMQRYMRTGMHDTSPVLGLCCVWICHASLASNPMSWCFTEL